MNNKTMTYSVLSEFADFEIECIYFDEIFDKTMTERLKELSGAIISFSNRESDEVDGQPCFGGGWFLVTIDTPDGAYGYH